MTEEIYPMPFFSMLIVRDLDASARWYQDALGFKHIYSMPGPGGGVGLVHLRWIKYADLLITRSRSGEELPGSPGAGVSLNFQLFDRFQGDITAFAARARSKGANVAGPFDQPWNVREVTVLDPDGYRLVFTSPINTGLGLEELIEQVTNPSPPDQG